jgi:hypothetical protein
MMDPAIHARYATHWLRADQYAEATARAVRIVERVLPLGRTGHNPLVNGAGYMAAAMRHGSRSELYRTIYPRLLAKVQARDSISLRADEELSLSNASEATVPFFGKAA